MQIIKSCIKLLILLAPSCAVAQTTYMDRGSNDEHFVERIEIKQQTNTGLNFSTLKPFNRKYAVEEIEFLDSARMGYYDKMGRDKFREWTDLNTTSKDEYNMRHFLMNNSEWVLGSQEGFSSKKSLGVFYQNKANFYEVNTPDFFMAINPMLQLNYSFEKDNKETVFLNAKGASVRGHVAGKVGFSAMILDNQERGPRFYEDAVAANRAVPGVGFYKEFKTTAHDYYDARGYFTFNAAKFINFQAGFDKNFIGNGYRSLFLSDVGNSYLFVKINTRIWKLNYQNLFMELHPQFVKTSDTLLDRKYAAMHHLSMNVTKWLNIGLFEGVVFGRKNRFDFSYLNPIIFYRHIEGNNGSPDNALLGLDVKANVGHVAQVYGQFLMDEFILSKVKNDPSNWVNKFGVQAGIKYVDAFSIDNLDLQFEFNRVRPFTYSRDSVSNYTHYNQPLAHPLGANFNEFLFVAKYQPANKWFVDARAFFSQKGLDSTGQNWGGNIFRFYGDRIGENGFYVAGGGHKNTVMNAIVNVSYEVKPNLFIDLGGQYRTSKIQNVPGKQESLLGTLGLRLNMVKKVYDN